MMVDMILAISYRVYIGAVNGIFTTAQSHGDPSDVKQNQCEWSRMCIRNRCV